MKWVQYVFDGFRSIVPRRKYHTYAIKFMWQITPFTILIAIYYSMFELLPENHPYLLRLYDLKAVEVAKPKVEDGESKERVKEDGEIEHPVEVISPVVLTPEAI